jgi:hypothetical protein
MREAREILLCLQEKIGEILLCLQEKIELTRVKKA